MTTSQVWLYADELHACNRPDSRRSLVNTGKPGSAQITGTSLLCRVRWISPQWYRLTWFSIASFGILDPKRFDQCDRGRTGRFSLAALQQSHSGLP
jgi:hypothetical protein